MTATSGRDHLRVAPNQTDLVAQAIARAQDQDVEALHFLYVRYADSVRGYVDSIVHDTYEAEDITQSLFVGLLAKIQRYQARDVPFAAWLLRVARNAALDHLRRRKAIPFEEVRTADDGDGELAFDRYEALTEALDRLPLDQREVLILRHVVGLSPGEIATRLAKTESSIHGLHHRGRTALKAALREFEAGPVTATG